MNYSKLFSNHHRHLSFGFLHYFFSLPGQSIIISLFMPHFNSRLGMDNEEFGLLYSVATLASAITIPVFGGLIDRYKVRYVSVVNGILLAFFAIMISFAGNWIVLLLAIYGLRFSGQGMMTLISSTAVSRFFDKERGLALSLSGLGLSVGEAVMPLVVYSLIEGFDWSTAWQMLGLGVLLVFVPLSMLLVGKNDAFQLPEAKEEAVKIPEKSKGRKEVLREWKFYLLLLPAICPSFILTGLFIHQNLLAQHQGWTMEWMATCFVFFGVIKIATYFFAGPLIDLVSARRLFPFILIPLSLGLIVLLVSNHPYAAIFYLLLAGISNCISGVTATALWVEIYGVANLGAIKSAISAFFVASTSTGAMIFGLLMKNKEIMQYTLLVSVIVMVVVSYSAFLVLKQERK